MVWAVMVDGEFVSQEARDLVLETFRARWGPAAVPGLSALDVEQGAAHGHAELRLPTETEARQLAAEVVAHAQQTDSPWLRFRVSLHQCGHDEGVACGPEEVWEA